MIPIFSLTDADDRRPAYLFDPEASGQYKRWRNLVLHNQPSYVIGGIIDLEIKEIEENCKKEKCKIRCLHREIFICSLKTPGSKIVPSGRRKKSKIPGRYKEKLFGKNHFEQIWGTYSFFPKADDELCLLKLKEDWNMMKKELQLMRREWIKKEDTEKEKEQDAIGARQGVN